MTWSEWVDSSYNIGGFSIYNNTCTTEPGFNDRRVVHIDWVIVRPDEQIIENQAYSLTNLDEF